MIGNKNGWDVIHRIVNEFHIVYPKLHKKYFGWKTCSKWVIPNSLEFLQLTTVDEIIQFFGQSLNLQLGQLILVKSQV